jgi:AraC-like DNA-binding protein
MYYGLTGYKAGQNRGRLIDISNRSDRVHNLSCGHNGSGVVGDIDVESGVHLFVQVIRRRVFYHRDVVAWFSSITNSCLVIREIVCRLLSGEQAHRMRHLATVGGHAHRMVRAVNKLREEFAKPLSIESMAKDLGMSVSGFHAHFKAVTAMSPLQFQKQLRLQEARRLMLTESLDAGEAGFQVGYDDQSHFSREYKRHFGHPPIRDIRALREVIEEAAGTPARVHRQINTFVVTS